jgi:hypothetical protein
VKDKIRVGQAVVFKGAAALVREIGDEDAEGHYWVKLATHVGEARVPHDHPELVIM